MKEKDKKYNAGFNHPENGNNDTWFLATLMLLLMGLNAGFKEEKKEDKDITININLKGSDVNV